MADAGFLHKISGADKFQVLLHRHIRLNGNAGNVISLSIKVKGRITADELRSTVSTNRFLTQINSLEIEQRFLQIPRWKNGAQQNSVKITEHAEAGNNHILQPDIKINSGNLIDIALVQGEHNSTVVISVHHVLADNMGIQCIAKIIDGSVNPPSSPFANEEKDTGSLVQQLMHTLKATRLVFKKTPNSLAKISVRDIPASDLSDNIAHISVINFTAEETLRTDKLAAAKGARLSKSAFYLAATSMALQQSIFKNTEGDTFFLPVPQNQRLRGNEQVALGNQLSFLFYNIPFNKLNNLSEATAFITEQMMKQIKEQSPKSYSYLLKTFRFLPLALYDLFFKMPTKGAVCSFLFSDVGETLPDIKTFMGREITDVLNLPPNPCPPHITLVFMKHAGALKIITAYNPQAISGEEITKFEDLLTALLKNENT